MTFVDQPQIMYLGHFHNPAACTAQDLLSGTALHAVATHMARCLHFSVTLLQPTFPECAAAQAAQQMPPLAVLSHLVVVPSYPHCGPADATSNSVAWIPAPNLRLPCMLQQGPPQACLSWNSRACTPYLRAQGMPLALRKLRASCAASSSSQCFPHLTLCNGCLCS